MISHRQSRLANSCNPPKPVPSLFHHLSLPQHASVATPPSSPPPVRLVQSPFPSSQLDPHTLASSHSNTTLSPSPSPSQPQSPCPVFRLRRKPYGNLGLTGATRELVLNFEERIAHLESSHTKISVELEATRDALIHERAERASERNFMPSPSHLVVALDGQFNAGTNVACEWKLRHEMLCSLKGQNAGLVRTLREREERCTTLTDDLETERTARKQARDEIAQLSSANFNLSEHNKLLVDRDAALQIGIFSLITKSHPNTWMPKVFEADLHGAHGNAVIPPLDGGDNQTHPIEFTHHLIAFPLQTSSSDATHPTPGLSLPEKSTSILTQLISTRDELHITQTRLAASVRQCTTLTERMASLQANITLCVDESARALEVERELRADIELRVRELLVENEALRRGTGTRPAESETGETRPYGEVWRKVGEFERVEEITVNASKRIREYGKEDVGMGSGVKSPLPAATRRTVVKQDVELDMERRERTLLQEASKMAENLPNSQRFHGRKPRLLQAKKPSYDSPSTRALRSFITPSPDGSPQRSASSPCSTAVATPTPTPTSSKHHKRMSVILAATLSKDLVSAQGALKTESSVFVDITNTCGSEATPPRLDTVDLAFAKQSASIKSYMKRASAIFGDIALTGIERVDACVNIV